MCILNEWSVPLHFFLSSNSSLSFIKCVGELPEEGETHLLSPRTTAIKSRAVDLVITTRQVNTLPLTQEMEEHVGTMIRVRMNLMESKILMVMMS